MKKILVLGDLMLDIVTRGNVNRMSPNSCVPILNKTTKKFYLGGAGNVYHNIKLFGVDVDIYSALGEDPSGEMVLKLIQDPSQKENLIIDKKLVTTVKGRYVTESDQDLLRVDVEKIIQLSADCYSKIEANILKKIDQYEIVIFSDYCKGFLSDGFIKNIIQQCKRYKVKIFVDTKRQDVAVYKGCDLLKITKKELFNIFRVDSSDDVVDYAKKIKKILECDSVIITDAENPLYYVFGQEELRIFYPEKIKAVDSTGAGDVFIAALAVKIIDGYKTFSSISFAMNMCSIAIGVSGTSVIDEKILLNDMYKEKIIHRIMERKENGERIIFVNGCFDILHMGHINMLKAAKNAGDVLIVGINSDESVKRIKGSSRPINSQEDRCALLNTIKYIDYVVVFNEDNPCELIKEIKPHIIFKGSDYKGKKIPEDEILEKINCEIRYIEKSMDQSTSNIIERIIKND